MYVWKNSIFVGFEAILITSHKSRSGKEFASKEGSKNLSWTQQNAEGMVSYSH